MSHGTEESEEVDGNQLEQARRMGEAYLDGVRYMAEEVAHTGDTTEVGDYVVGFAQEEAEGLYTLTANDEFVFDEPDAANCHLEVVVADADDGRFVPECTVVASFVDESGEEHGPWEVPFLWHPGRYHYGRNVEVPGDGTYDLRVAVEPPRFPRRDERNGERVEVVFEDVDVATGQD